MRLRQAVEQALRLLGGPADLTVLVNDPQRHTDTRSVLLALAEQRPALGVRVLVATGTHRFPEDVRRRFERALLGAWPCRDVAWHDCRDRRLRRIGGSWRGHPWLAEGRPVLAIGSVEPHYFAGFTGAHKTATIGCASWKDIQANHALTLDPSCRPGRLEGNPVFQGVRQMLSALESFCPLAAVNLVQSGRTILAAAGGRPLEALGRVLNAARRAFVRRLPRPADAVVAEVTGPLAQTFYQADKGIKNNEWAVRDGGCLVLVASCRGGIGQDHFFRLLRQAATYKAALQIVRRRGYRLGDHKAVRLRYLTDAACRGVRVFLVGGLSGQEAAVLGLTKAAGVRQALAAAGVDPRRDRICRIPDAGNCCVIPDDVPPDGTT